MQIWRVVSGIAKTTLLSVWFLITSLGPAIAGFLGQPRPGRITLGVFLAGTREARY